MGNTNHKEQASGPSPNDLRPRSTSSSSSSLIAASRLIGRRNSGASTSHPNSNKRSLSGEGQSLFANMMVDGAVGDKEAHEDKQIAADLGAKILNAGLNASNKTRIQEFALANGSICSECVDGDPPRWCVIGFGVFVCDDCAGAFRSLPATVHGGVRSLYLDDWTDDMYETATSYGGNEKVNSEMEFHVPDTIRKPRKGVSSGNDRRMWLTKKYRNGEFKSQPGKVASRAVAAQLKPQQIKLHPSFTAGKELLVGVIDVTVLHVQDLPNPIFTSRRLFGGFVLGVTLGRFRGETASSLSGRKWNGQRIHLSWDGHSPLDVAIRTGSGKVLGHTVRELRELNTQLGNRTLNVDVTIEAPSARSYLEDLKLAGKGNAHDDEPQFIRVSMRLDFVDLRS